MLVQFSSEGSLWQDPPGYWDDIVWPAYRKAHKDIFIAGDVSEGDPVPADDTEPTSEISGTTDVSSSNESSTTSSLSPRCGQPVAHLMVLPAETIPINELFDKTCKTLQAYLASGLQGPARTL